jgi:hypothetical protein
MFNFVKFVAKKKGMTTNFFSTLSFVAVIGSGIQDKHPGSAPITVNFKDFLRVYDSNKPT